MTEVSKKLSSQATNTLCPSAFIVSKITGLNVLKIKVSPVSIPEHYITTNNHSSYLQELSKTACQNEKTEFTKEVGSLQGIHNANLSFID